MRGDVLVDPALDDSTPDDLDCLVLFQLFDRPGDYPDRVVVVRNVSRRDGTLTRLHWLWPFRTVDAAREFLGELGLHPIPRDPTDVPSLVETWI
jgi:hypothetical protein